jgi:hypothetical protein
MLTKEFIDAVNEAIAREAIRPRDRRAREMVSDKTLKFYILKGLIDSPTRHGTRLEYNESHLEQVLDIKRRQAMGATLQEIADERKASRPWESLEAPVTTSWMLPTRDSDPNGVLKLMSVQSSPRRITGAMSSGHKPFASEVTVRWHLDLGGGTELSGIGPVPHEATIDRLKNLLADDRSSRHSTEEDE